MTKGIIKKLAVYTKAYLPQLALAIICTIAGAGLSLLSPVLIGRAIDHIIGAGNVDFTGLAPVLAGIAAAVAGSAVLTWLATLATNRISYSVARDMRVAAFARLQKVPLRYIDRRAHGDVINSVINDVDQISDGLLQGFSQLLSGIATIAGTLVFMLTINPLLTLVVAVITPLSLFVASFIAKRSYHSFREQMEQRGEINGYAGEMISGHEVVKAFGHEGEAQNHFEEMNSKLYKSGVTSQFYSSISNPATRFVNALVYAAVGVVGALFAIGGSLSVGQLSSFLIYAGQYTKPFNEISGVITELQAALVSAQRIIDIIESEEEPPDAADAVAMGEARGEVRVSNVNFSYTPDTKLIEGLNLYTQPGDRVAIVGPTGSGKTTIINLLMRFYDVDSGTISIDGVDIKAMTRDSLRGLYGMVLQETWLFAGTVRDNIAFGKPEATLEEVAEAAKAASAHSFIKRLRDGYDTVLSEGGGISEGQKQLLCIARAMLVKPSMLILDEATSSIDTRTEIKIQKAFAKMMEGRTSFVVAHRLSTIREADIILVMKDGGIVEQGSHSGLLAKDGFYAKLWGSQFDGEE